MQYRSLALHHEAGFMTASTHRNRDQNFIRECGSYSDPLRQCGQVLQRIGPRDRSVAGFTGEKHGSSLSGSVVELEAKLLSRT
jgi:hypothetical protein